MKNSFRELKGRERARAILDNGTFRELVGPFEKLESPYLEMQDITPQSDDGMIIAKGKIDGKNVVVISMEGAFQGGGIGEIAGAKFAKALELAAKDNEKGIKTYPVVLFDTGGVRLQEANYGLLEIAAIQSAVLKVRNYVPVTGVIPGKVGCFGGMSMTAGLFSTLIMTPQGRLTLNGPEVIEQEAGVLEFDASDKRLIWNTVGGVQRVAIGLGDVLVEDDVCEVKGAIKKAINDTSDRLPRSRQFNLYLSRLNNIEPEKPLSYMELRSLWGEDKINPKDVKFDIVKNVVSEDIEKSRGRIWFEALTGIEKPKTTRIKSVLCDDVKLGNETVRYISIVPDKNAKFYRARKGEVGLEEGWMVAKYIFEAIEEDKNKAVKRPIVAVIDVPSQAYGYKEELLGISQACAGAVDAYATARENGHPVIGFIPGMAISGAFLSHGYQANRLIALDDEGVLVHAMSKQSAARITKRTVEELDEAAKKIPAIAYDVKSYSKLGALYKLIQGINAENPKDEEIDKIRVIISEAIIDTRKNQDGIDSRLTSENAKTGREYAIEVYKRLEKEWNEA
ncbi:MAG: biotin-independent malonate decarboxylase subunit beta [Clostridium perfringens]|nr:biotin-independent malonate decarboxylase subunit beta [Clostridium perfringens]